MKSEAKGRHKAGQKSSARDRTWRPGTLGTIDDVCERSGMGRTFILGQIRLGYLPARKVGRRTLVHWDDYEAWWLSCPPARRKE